MVEFLSDLNAWAGTLPAVRTPPRLDRT